MPHSNMRARAATPPSMDGEGATLLADLVRLESGMNFVSSEYTSLYEYHTQALPLDMSDAEWEFVASYLTLMRLDAPQRDHDLGGRRLHQQEAGAVVRGVRRLGAGDRRARSGGAGLRGSAATMGGGTDVCVAGAQSSPADRLRAEDTNQRDAHRGGVHPLAPATAREKRMKNPKHALSPDNVLVGGGTVPATAAGQFTTSYDSSKTFVFAQQRGKFTVT